MTLSELFCSLCLVENTSGLPPAWEWWQALPGVGLLQAAGGRGCTSSTNFLRAFSHIHTSNLPLSHSFQNLRLKIRESKMIKKCFLKGAAVLSVVPWNAAGCDTVTHAAGNTVLLLLVGVHTDEPLKEMKIVVDAFLLSS